jgi:ketosteroid isomerase-like protein
MRAVQPPKGLPSRERVMSDESLLPNPVELVRQAFDAGNRHDLDAIIGFHSPEAVWDLSDQGLGVFEGAGAIRGWLEDWFGVWADLHLDVLEIVDLGHGVVFSSVREAGRLADGGHAEQERGWVLLAGQRKIARIAIYLDINEARAAAERLAQERG